MLNDAFRMHNEMKMLNKLNGKFKTEEHRKRFEQLNDEFADDCNGV